MKPWRHVLMILIVLTALFYSNPAQAEKIYSAERFDVTIEVQPDGSLLVAEKVTFRFVGGPFTYVVRELDGDRLDAIDSLQASMNGHVFTAGSQPGQVEIVAGWPRKVTWHFAPLTDGLHTFTLAYRVLGGIGHNAEADTLNWQAIPEEHDYAIQRCVIRLIYPEDIKPLSSPTLYGALTTLETGNRSLTFTTGEVKADQGLSLRLDFAPGSLVSKPPAWQLREEQRVTLMKRSLPYGLGTALFIGLIGVLNIIREHKRYRRPDTLLPAEGIYSANIATPPQPLPPAFAGWLIGSHSAFLGTLFDLAQRGVVQIVEGQGSFGMRKFEIHYRQGSYRLANHEQSLLDTLFDQFKADQADLTTVQNLGYNSSFSNVLEAEITTAGWRDPQRAALRTQHMVMSSLSLLLGLAVELAGLLIITVLAASGTQAVILGAMFLGMGFAMIVSGLVGLFIATRQSILTLDGMRQAERWNAFFKHLQDVTRGRAPASVEDFAHYLPYAAAFGMATEWSQHFKKIENIHIPDWFQSLQAGGEDGTFVAMMAAITAADSSAAVSGSDGGSSGGGASGAG